MSPVIVVYSLDKTHRGVLVEVLPDGAGLGVVLWEDLTISAEPLEMLKIDSLTADIPDIFDWSLR